MKSPFVKRKPAEPGQMVNIFSKNRSISGAPSKVDSEQERAGNLIGKLALSAIRLLHLGIIPLIYVSFIWSDREEFLDLLGTGFLSCLVVVPPLLFARFIANAVTVKEDESSYRAIGEHLIGTTVHAVISLSLYIALR